MVVVPLAHGDDCNPPAVLGQVIGFIWLVPPHVGPRVDCERDVEDCYNLHKHKTMSVSHMQASGTCKHLAQSFMQVAWQFGSATQ